MEIYQIDVAGYRKFKSSTRLKTRGKIVALLGSNEAGKSSLLSAIERLNDNDAFLPEDISHDLDVSKVSLKARFLLTDEDRKVASVPEAIWFEIQKNPNGKRKYTIIPWPKARETTHRAQLVKQLAAIQGKPKSVARIDALDDGLLREAKIVFDAICGGEDNLDQEMLDGLRALAERFSAIVDTSFPVYVQTFNDNLQNSVIIEGAPDKKKSAGEILWSRLPKFLIFSEADRNLKSAYSMSELTEGIPKALQNLAKVAECNLSELTSVYAQNSGDAKIDTIIERANKSLEANFRAVWKQSAVAVALSLRDQQLLVQVRNGDDRRTNFAQRSDGLRQFVALQCFTSSKGADDIVLLIDEAEQHLHYDAQADLMQMLASQTVAPKVIYSTHSAGCLPEDLGNGVRLVQSLPNDQDWSKIENKFWYKADGSFSPLLIGMGASTLAFLPMRLAIVVEGEADMLLYPTMFREALDRTSLGVQFVPGLSRVSIPNLPLLNSSGKRVCYLVDGDDGGRKLEQDLATSKIDPKRIFRLRRSNGNCELEDFLNPIILTSAINELGRLHYNDAVLVQPNSLPKYGKWDYIAGSCKAKGLQPFSKVEVAYSILDAIDADPILKILEPRLVDGFSKLAQEMVEKLSSDPT